MSEINKTMYNITIILTFHREGALAQKTIDNIRNVVSYTKKTKSWSNIDVIAMLDNSDHETKDILYKNKDILNVIQEVHFCDLGESRNEGIRIAKGNFIAFADGDDYISHDALELMYKCFYKHYTALNVFNIEQLNKLDNNLQIALFPELSIEFPNLFFLTLVSSNNYIVNNMKFGHYYLSRICIPKVLLQSNKYRANTNPYGYEDWDLNNRLLSLGVKFIVVEGYVFYYRKMQKQSLLSNQILNQCVVRNSDIHRLRLEDTNNNIEKDILINQISHKYIYKLKDMLRGNMMLFKFIKKLYKSYKQRQQKLKFYFNKFKNKQLIVSNDDFIHRHIEFLKFYNEDGLQLRDGTAFGSYEQFSIRNLNEVLVYDEIIKFLEDKEFVYLIPWINMGGADNVILNYISSLDSMFKIGVIFTLMAGPRASRLNVPSLDLSVISGYNDLLGIDKSKVLLRAIINSDNIKCIHIVQSEPGLQMTHYYGEIFADYHKKVIVTSFCPDAYDKNTQSFIGYPYTYNKIYKNADYVLSDNNFWYQTYKELNNNNDFKFMKLCSPSDINYKYDSNRERNNKILWASRICSQKIFEVFCELVKKMPEYTFVIYGDVPHNEEYLILLDSVRKLTNIEFRGEYNHIDELNINEFDLYLYTSFFDGIPTIVIDMLKLGIPVIASNVGGISELFDSNYDLLVDNVMNEDAYIEKIELFYLNIDKNVNYISKISNKLVNDYSFNNFKSNYIRIVNEVLDGNW